MNSKGYICSPLLTCCDNTKLRRVHLSEEADPEEAALGFKPRWQRSSASTTSFSPSVSPFSQSETKESFVVLEHAWITRKELQEYFEGIE